MEKLFTIDIEKATAAPAKHGYGPREGMVTVTRGGTTFQRRQKIGRKQPEPSAGRQKASQPGQSPVGSVLLAVAKTPGAIGSAQFAAELANSVWKNKKLNKKEAKDLLGTYSEDISSMVTHMGAGAAERATGKKVGADERELVSTIGHKMLNLTFGPKSKLGLGKKMWANTLGALGMKDTKKKLMSKWTRELKSKNKLQAQKEILNAVGKYTTKKALNKMLQSREFINMYGGPKNLGRALKLMGDGNIGNLPPKVYKNYQKQTKDLTQLINLVGKKFMNPKQQNPSTLRKIMNGMENRKMASLFAKSAGFVADESMSILSDVGMEIPTGLRMLGKLKARQLGRKAGMTALSDKNVRNLKGGTKRLVGNIKR